MKKFVFLTVIIFFANYSLLFSQEQLPNSNMEYWTDTNTALNWVSSFTYGSWIFHTAHRTTDALFGNYAAKLYSQTIYIYHIPAFLLLGDLDLNTGITVKGKPFHSKPNALSVFLKFVPNDTDDFKISGYISHWDTLNNHRDTLAIIDYYKKTNIKDQQYIRLDLPFFYAFGNDNLPVDSILVAFYCSTSEEFSHDSTYLYIDSIALKYEYMNLPTQALFPTYITDTSFIARWYPVKYATGYLIDIATDSLFSNTLSEYHNLFVDSTHLYVHLSPEKGTQYFYRVRVLYANDTSEYSNIIKIITPTPTKALPAQQITATSFIAVWQKQNLAQTYLLDVAHDRNFKIFVSGLHNKEINDTNFVVSGLSPNDSIFYRVRVKYMHNVISEYSNVIALKTSSLSKTDKEPEINISINGNLLILKGKDLVDKSLIISNLNGQIIKKIQKIKKEYIIIPLPHNSIYTLKLFNNSSFELSKTIFIK